MWKTPWTHRSCTFLGAVFIHSPHSSWTFKKKNMKYALGIRLLPVAVVCLSVRCEDDEDCKKAQEQRGFCFLNHKYKEIQAVSLSHCYMNCARESSCHSVNFFSDATKRCEMNTKTWQSHPEDFTKCEDSTYMENIFRGKRLLTENWSWWKNREYRE